jgi:uncharacterized protein with ATP-grasp and redox domains
MKMQPECMLCLYNQSLRVTKVLECGRDCAESIMHEAARVISCVDMDATPPEAAALLYPAIAEVAGVSDIYAAKKVESTDRAMKIAPLMRERIEESANPVEAAIKVSVAGNVLDFATEKIYDFEEECEKIFESDFSVYHGKEILKRLENAKRVLIIGDNSAEHIFDALLAERISIDYPETKISYAVRGRAIINDVTMAEATGTWLESYCEIVDSGVDTPGFLYERATEEMRELFDEADLILSKGMGNFECMDTMADERLFFLFKIKCPVVARRTGYAEGSLMVLCSDSLAV